MCGAKNSITAATCESCGALLQTKKIQQPSLPPTRSERTTSPTTSRFKFLQSWKFTVALAAILIIILVIIRQTTRDNLPQGLSQHDASVVREIESLQKTVEKNPKDEQSLLKLGNSYFDMKMFPQAIMMYDRYLELVPTNPDARVDMGVSYFEIALEDSSLRDEYFSTAKNEMKKVLTYAPNHQLAHYNLGMVSLHAGEFEEAVEWFKKCAAIDSSSETGRRAQAFLKQHQFTNPS
jgi:tetratricopeptide (TPR) repeat protein